MGHHMQSPVILANLADRKKSGLIFDAGFLLSNDSVLFSCLLEAQHSAITGEAGRFEVNEAEACMTVIILDWERCRKKPGSMSPVLGGGVETRTLEGTI